MLALQLIIFLKKIIFYFLRKPKNMLEDAVKHNCKFIYATNLHIK